VQASAPQARETIVRLRRAVRASRGPLNADVRHRMSRLSKGLLLVEIAVCFIPVSALLGFGILMLLVQVRFFATIEVSHFDGPLYLLAFVASGICGLTALYCVMRWLLYGIRANLKPRIVVILMCVGLTPLIYLAVQPEVVGRYLVVLPLLSSAHLLWLSRSYLFDDA
jgi:hypothetical protein